MGLLFNRSNVNVDFYPWALRDAYRQAIRVYDPDYAIFKDAEFYDKLERDSEIRSAVQMRRHMISLADWTIQPGGSEDADERLAAVVEDLVLSMPGFLQARMNLARAFLVGSTYAMIRGDRSLSMAGGIEAGWWRPTGLEDMEKRRFRRVVGDDRRVSLEVYSIERDNWEVVDNPEWLVKHVYDQTEQTLGYGNGLSSALYFLLLWKAVATERGLQGLDRWAQGQTMWGIDAEQTGGKPLASIVREYLDEYEKMRSHGVFVHDKRDEMKLVDGPAQGHQIVTFWVEHLDRKVWILILGSHLPAESKGEGSLALSKTQAQTRNLLVAYDQDLLAETLTRDLVGLTLRLNRPQIEAAGLSRARPPRLSLMMDPERDSLKAAQVAGTALEAGIPLRKDEVYEKIGYTPPAPGEEVIEPRAVPAGPGAPGARPF